VARETTPLARKAAEDGGGGGLALSCADMNRFYLVESSVPNKTKPTCFILLTINIIITVILSNFCVVLCCFVLFCTQKQGHPKWVVVGQMRKDSQKDYVGFDARAALQLSNFVPNAHFFFPLIPLNKIPLFLFPLF